MALTWEIHEVKHHKGAAYNVTFRELDEAAPTGRTVRVKHNTNLSTASLQTKFKDLLKELDDPYTAGEKSLKASLVSANLDLTAKEG